MRKLSRVEGIALHILILSIFLGLFLFARDKAKAEIDSVCEHKAEQDLHIMLTYFDKELSQAEQAAKTFAATVFENGHHVPDSSEIYRQEKLFLEANPNLSSIAIGFEPRVVDRSFPGGSGGMITLQTKDGPVGHPMKLDPDFRSLDWYNVAIHRECRLWCRPYWSPTSHNPITTYSVPLYSEHHHLVGVIGISMNLSRFDSISAILKPYPNAIPAALLNRDLTFLMHPIKDYPLNMDLKSDLAAIGEEPSDELLVGLGSRQRGKLKVNWNKREQTVFYAPVEKAECSVMLVIDDETARNGIASNYVLRAIGLSLGAALSVVFFVYLMLTKDWKRKRQQNA